MAAKAITPDDSLGAHTTPLGLVFYTASAFPSPWQGGAFISQHGSWNRSHFSGYKVVWVRFENGMPVGQPVDFLTEFMPDVASGIAFGRRVGLALDKSGNLLVADDTGGIIWRVAPVHAGGESRSGDVPSELVAMIEGELHQRVAALQPELLADRGAQVLHGAIVHAQHARDLLAGL